MPPRNVPQPRPCQRCGRLFQPKQTALGDGWTHYCGRACANAHNAEAKRAGRVTRATTNHAHQRHPEADRGWHRGQSEPCERHKVQTVTSRRGGVQHIECQACGAWRDVVMEAVW